MEEKKDIQQQQKRPQISPTLPVNGCLWIVILSALACMAVKGCKMVNMKYDEAKVKHEMVMDSLNKVRNDTIYYRGK
jgi:hypothetical protein